MVAPPTPCSPLPGVMVSGAASLSGPALIQELVLCWQPSSAFFPWHLSPVQWLVVPPRTNKRYPAKLQGKMESRVLVGAFEEHWPIIAGRAVLVAMGESSRLRRPVELHVRKWGLGLSCNSLARQWKLIPWHVKPLWPRLGDLSIQTVMQISNSLFADRNDEQDSQEVQVQNQREDDL